MKFRLLHEWPRYVRSRRPRENWRGPRRALPLDEQAEVLRAMREAKASRTRHSTARDLAERYGVSLRTIWRYADTLPVPDGLEFLRMRLTDWNQERGLALTHDDLATLLMVIARHRDLYPTSRSASESAPVSPVAGASRTLARRPDQGRAPVAVSKLALGVQVADASHGPTVADGRRAGRGGDWAAVPATQTAGSGTAGAGREASSLRVSRPPSMRSRND